MIARAVCMVLPRHPALNSSIDMEAGTATFHRYINLGMAVDTERGLLVPNIKDAQDLTVPGLARRSPTSPSAPGQEAQPDEISGGTFTITNTGSRRHPVRHADPQPAGGRDPGHLRDREAPGGRLRRLRRLDRDPLDELPVPVLRPPHGRRRRRGPVPAGPQVRARDPRLRVRELGV
jgi:hypothetical protein